MFDVIGKRKWFFLFSGLILVPGLIFILMTPLTNGKMGLQFSVDYTGGTVWQFQVKDPNVSISQIRAILSDHKLGEAEVNQDTDKYFTVRTKETNLLPVATPTPKPSLSPTAAPSGSPAASESAGASATPGASASASSSPSPSPSASPSATPAPTAVTKANSTNQKGGDCTLDLPKSGELAKVAADINGKVSPIICTGQTSTVGAIVSNELVQQAILLILFGSLGIMIWVSIRFWAAGGFMFGATALAALVHDVIVVVGIFAILGTLFGVQIDSLFVTAMLTVIGFSVHDTIVVFDRIRENKARHAGEPFDRIVNHSILQTFGRSINTSLTVVITLLALLLFGGSAIHYFVLALLIGIISGTYSSIFNASPLLVVWQLYLDRRRARKLSAQRTPGRPARRAQA